MSPKINVLNLRNSIVDGGPEKAILMWYQHIDKDRFNPSLACFANPGATEASFMNMARAIDFPAYLIPWGRRKQVVAAVRSLTRLIREKEIHLLHSHDAKFDVVAFLASRLANIPVVGVAYAWFGKTSQFRVRFYEWLDIRLLNTFQAVVAVSESLKSESIERGVRAHLIHHVYSGIDYDSFQQNPDVAAIRRALGLSPGDFVLINLARLWPEKGQTFLLKALRDVVSKDPRAKLVVVGKGPLLPELTAEAASLGLTGHVVWAGFPDRLPDLIRSADLQVHPSVYEGLPMALLSGMAAGLPVIATDVGGVSEIVVNEETGLLIPSKSPEHLAKAILSLMGDPARARSLGDAARATMFRKHRVQVTIRKLEDVYQSVFDAHYGRKDQLAV